MRKVYIVSYMEPLIQSHYFEEDEEWPGGHFSFISRKFNAARRLANVMFRKGNKARRTYIFPSEVLPLDRYSRSEAMSFQTREEAEAAIAKHKAEAGTPDNYFIYSIEEVEENAA